MESITKVLADNLKALRIKYGWTQAETAERASMAWRTYQEFEYERRWPRPVQVQKLAKAFGINPSQLFNTQSGAQQPSVTLNNEDLKNLLALSPDEIEPVRAAIRLARRRKTKASGNEEAGT